MIRLSEAIAKVNCVEEVAPHMVIEAYDLLKQSIIRVEKEDVDVDEDDEEEVNRVRREDGDGDSPMADGNDDGDDGGEGPSGGAGVEMNGTPAPPRKQKTKITSDKYNSIVYLLTQRIQQDELENGDGVGGDTLVEWYLEQKEGDLGDEDEYHAEKELVRKVIKRMVKVCAPLYHTTTPPFTCEKKLLMVELG